MAPAAAAAAQEASIPAPVYPVILCGGAGERLWPASRPWRPKPFLRLVGPHSGFQQTLQRAAPLAAGGGELVVVAGETHAGLVAEQLDEIGLAATVLLEPMPRDTAAAIAAAASWVARRGPDGVLAILPADHHAPEAAAFRSAVEATLPAAQAGAIVTLGVRPTSPSSAYGYIRPGAGEGAVKAIDAFVEKPDPAAAEALIAGGALWNSGMFIARADTLLSETRRWAPEVARAATAAVEAAGATLGASFAEAPRIAFDRAVMERTDRGAVLPVAFAWSDLGAWDAVAAAAGEAVLTRAPPGVEVAVLGLSGVAVVVEADAVLVAALDHAQAVRDLAGRRPCDRFIDLAAAGKAHDTWLRTAALPLWGTVGVEVETGAFREGLTWDGAPADPRRRARVQARQAFVFASAAFAGIPGPWLRAARDGMGFLLAHGRRDDGRFAASLDLAGRPEDPTGRLYDQTFVLLALAALQRADPAEARWPREAEALADALDGLRHAEGGFREVDGEAFQANAQMHLFEAALAWESAGGGPRWIALSDELATLALDRFIDPATGALREFFDAGWRAKTGEAGLIEPGHQFEWAWLLARWGRARTRDDALEAARRLFAVGRRGWDPARGVIQNALWDDLGVREAGARLWPQTEHLKAALALGEAAAALEAANSLARYLDTPARGVWCERMRPDGGFVAEPSPATSLYHLYLAIRELAAHAGTS